MAQTMVYMNITPQILSKSSNSNLFKTEMHIQTRYTSTVTQKPLIAAETVSIFHCQIKIPTSYSSVLHKLTLPLTFPSSPSITYDPVFFLSYITWPNTAVRRSCIINTTPTLLTAVTLHKKKIYSFSTTSIS